MISKFRITLFLTFITALNIFAQESPVYTIEKKLKSGDVAALFEMANYFDSKEEITEHLGYHIIETTESSVAKRIINENCIFSNNELQITADTSTNDFLTFLEFNKSNILFYKPIEAFIFSPLEDRTVNVQFREIPSKRRTELQVRYQDIIGKQWVKFANIDDYIEQHNPKALLAIASELYKIRHRFDTYIYTQEEYTDLLQKLTNIEIAVEDQSGKITWHIDKEFYPEPSLNLLIYFSKNYSHFKWDDNKSVFVNDGIKVNAIGPEENLFSLLSDPNGEVALNAFAKLSTLNPEKVTQLSTEFDKSDIEFNYAIPTFPYRFLKQMVVLTAYCRANVIDYNGSAELKLAMVRLEYKKSFYERRRLEEKMIDQLTLGQITAFEYWALINEKSYELTYSAGRILDIFYSRHWNEVLNDPKQLQLYLKKCDLYKKLGIIGVCNNYTQKFINNKSKGIDKLNLIQTSDNDIINQIKIAAVLCTKDIERPNDLRKFNDGNLDYPKPDLSKRIDMVKEIEDDDKREDELLQVLSEIDYSQIGTAINQIENINFKSSYKDKYSFLESDWGFFNFDFGTSAARAEFLALYDTKTEYELYSYMLDQAGINYKSMLGTIDYYKIFEILKHNVVIAFVGGGGGAEDNEVYAIIKILELTHKTTLGYPKKDCNSHGIYGCDSQDKANEWMQYLLDNKLVKEDYENVVSFH
jgi:hypothetical protein